MGIIEFIWTKCHRWGRRHWRVLAGAVAGLSVLSFIMAPRPALLAYLSAFLFASAIPLGAMAWLLVVHLAEGRWGARLRPALGWVAATIPILAILFLPVALGMSVLYPWVAEHGFETELAPKAAYLNPLFFLIRSGLFFLIWCVTAWLFGRWTEERDVEPTTPSSRLAAPALILYVLSASFAAVDWLGSLEPQWFSSIFGLYIIMGQAVAGMAALILLETSPELHQGEVITDPDILHDLGTLLLTVVVLHAYFAYSQFFIIWNGNLPHEIRWFVPRIHGVWGAVALLLIIIHFLLPFALLLMRQVKRQSHHLRRVAWLVLTAQWLESLWIVLPSHRGAALGLMGLGILFTALVGGLWAGSLWLLPHGWKGWRPAPSRDSEVHP